jgi:Ala-tRNA(Pro) deacylase
LLDRLAEAVISNEEGSMPGNVLIHEFLREARVPYTIVPHRPAFTAQEEAAATHITGREWAKVVICFVDGEPVQAVLPATMNVNLGKLVELARGADIQMAEESELRELFPDCEPGAMPPFGPLYLQRVFVDVALAVQPELAFNAGTHTEAVVMRWPDFAAMVRPIVGSFAEQPRGADGR